MTKTGAETGTRTRDLFITNELLYQLSHFGITDMQSYEKISNET